MNKRISLALSILAMVGCLIIGFLVSQNIKQDKIVAQLQSDAENNSVSSSFEVPSIDQLEKALPDSMKGRAEQLRQAMLAGLSQDISCTLVTPDEGESLGTALANMLKTNGGVPAAFCIEPGEIDQEIDLHGPITLYLKPGVYTQSKSIVLSGAGASLVGDNPGSTVLMYKDGLHGPNVLLDNVAVKYRVNGLTLTRETPGTQDGDNGIRTGAFIDRGIMENLFIQNQFDGMYLRATNYSRVRNIFVFRSQRNGILMTNLWTDTEKKPLSDSCQYYLNDILIQSSKGYGIYVSPDSVHKRMTLGNWSGILTNASESGGVLAQYYSPTKAVYGIRINDSFFGTDGAIGGGAEIQIMGGSMHNISNTFIEQAGAHPSLPLHADVPGILLGENVTSAQINGVYMTNNSGPGILINGTNVMITSSSFIDNGRSTTIKDYHSGIFVAGADSKVNVGVNQFVNDSGKQSTGIISYSANVSQYGNFYDLSGTTQGYRYIGPANSKN